MKTRGLIFIAVHAEKVRFLRHCEGLRAEGEAGPKQSQKKGLLRPFGARNDSFSARSIKKLDRFIDCVTIFKNVTLS
jgi:hypothetical protein